MEITLGEMYIQWGDEHIDFYLDGVLIGYWFVERVLQPQYGRFISNEYLESLVGKRGFGGTSWEVRTKIERAILEVKV